MIMSCLRLECAHVSTFETPLTVSSLWFFLCFYILCFCWHMKKHKNMSLVFWWRLHEETKKNRWWSEFIAWLCTGLEPSGACTLTSKAASILVWQACAYEGSTLQTPCITPSWLTDTLSRRSPSFPAGCLKVSFWPLERDATEPPGFHLANFPFLCTRQSPGKMSHRGSHAAEKCCCRN